MKQDNRSLVPYALIESLRCLGNIHEARLFSWILAKAQSVLKYYNKNLGSINLQFAMNMARVTLPAKMLLAPGDDNYKDVPKSFGLANKTINYTTDSGSVYKLNIIAFPEYYKDQSGRSWVTFVIHNHLWHALLENFQKGYRIVNLLDLFHLTSRYSVILYLLLSQQKEYRVTLRELRALLGASRSYEKWNNLENRIIRNAIKDIHEHTNCKVNYTTERNERVRGHPVDIICFTFEYHSNNPIPEYQAQTFRQKCNLESIVLQELERVYEVKPQDLERLERLLLSVGNSTAQLRVLDRVTEQVRAKRIRNKVGYLYTSLKNEAEKIK